MDKAFSSIIKFFTFIVLVKSFFKNNDSENNNSKHIKNKNRLIVQDKHKNKKDSHFLKGFFLALALSIGAIAILNLIGSCTKSEPD